MNNNENSSQNNEDHENEEILTLQKLIEKVPGTPGLINACLDFYDRQNKDSNLQEIEEIIKEKHKLILESHERDKEIHRLKNEIAKNVIKNLNKKISKQTNHFSSKNKENTQNPSIQCTSKQACSNVSILKSDIDNEIEEILSDEDVDDTRFNTISQKKSISLRFKPNLIHCALYVDLPSKSSFKVYKTSSKQCTQNISICRNDKRKIKAHYHYIIDMEGADNKFKFLLKGKSEKLIKYWGQSMQIKTEEDLKKILKRYF